MRFDVVTLFPEIISKTFSFGVTGRALVKGLIEIKTWNPRNYSNNATNRIDDKPYSGGPGMVMQVEPIMKAIEAINNDVSSQTHVIYMSAQGKSLNQQKIKELSILPRITIISGRYEGIDQRVIDRGIDEEISIGDFIASGGELPAMILMDSVTRVLEGVLGHNDSTAEESFENGLLEYPHYTRPNKSKYGEVPSVLLSGNSKDIERWKLKMSLAKTLLVRPDLLKGRLFSSLEKELLNEIKDEEKY